LRCHALHASSGCKPPRRTVVVTSTIVGDGPWVGWERRQSEARALRRRLKRQRRGGGRARTRACAKPAQTCRLALNRAG
jgi:hypothetical protein